jgi:protein-disulfide isomerase
MPTQERIGDNINMRLLVAQCLLCLIPAFAQTKPAAQTKPPAVDWQTARDLPQVDFTGLSTAQKAAALKELRAQPCLCGCGMKVAECRIKDPNCSDSRGLAQVIIKAIHEGRNPQYAIEHSDLVARRTGAPNVLEKPIPLSIHGSPFKGPANARITLVEFSDFECPYCSKAAAKVEAILQAYPSDARLVYKQYPLPDHPNARMAAEAALAANAQNKFWLMHDKLFANSDKLSAAKIAEIAKDAGLDMARFQADWKSGKFKAAVDKDIADGDKATVSGTPTIFINGKRYNGPLEMAVLKPLLDSELQVKK